MLNTNRDMILLIVIIGGIALAFCLISIIGENNTSTKTSKSESALIEFAEMLAKECENACKEDDIEKAQFCTDMLKLLS